VFAGGIDKLREASVALLGGHTVQDGEIKFGYAITGEVDPSSIWSNAGAKPGDALLLTKPLGTGIISTAIKFGRAPGAAVDAAVQSMIRLNRAASAALRGLPAGAVHGCTDITGFGLVGHAVGLAAASRCTVEIDAASVPVLPGALDLVEGNVPGGGRTNAQHFGSNARIAPGIDPRLAQILYDPQTSGGLLAAIAPEYAEQAADALRAAGISAALVGRVVPSSDARVIVL
jgi:selenide,water dikinase